MSSYQGLDRREFVGRNEQTPNLPELRSLRRGCFREHGINAENCVCAVPARLCDLVPAYCEKCGLNRREFVAGVSVGLGSVALTAAPGQEPAWWRFFTNHESRLVDAIAEQIIPADEDPGGRDAGVVNFIDKQLVGHYHRFAESYRRGLIGLEETARAMFNSGFLDLAWDEQTEVLSALEAGSAPGETWRGESSTAFFRLIRNHTMQGFYGSPRHGGNRGYASYRMLDLDYPQIIGRSRYLGK